MPTALRREESLCEIKHKIGYRTLVCPVADRQIVNRPWRQRPI